MDRIRCKWCAGDALMTKYHDEEWGTRQLHDDRALFEFMTLEAMQCGLSWRVVLRKREAMRVAFDGFDPRVITGYDADVIDRLMTDPGIIRSRPKLEAMITNARCFLRTAEEFGSFGSWFWAFTDGKTITNPDTQGPMPSKNALSEKISAEMKRRGFHYMGPVVVYSYMQAAGMVNDHEPDCFMRNRLR